MANRSKRTYGRGERLIAKLQLGYSIGAACKAERIGRQTFYEWRAEDADFAKRCDDAMENGTDVIEDVARKRAIDGDNTMIALMLKARRPDKYRERSDVQLSNADGAPFTINLVQSQEGPS
jgi:hypothetical protein